MNFVYGNHNHLRETLAQLGGPIAAEYATRRCAVCGGAIFLDEPYYSYRYRVLCEPCAESATIEDLEFLCDVRTPAPILKCLGFEHRRAEEGPRPWAPSEYGEYPRGGGQC